MPQSLPFKLLYFRTGDWERLRLRCGEREREGLCRCGERERERSFLRGGDLDLDRRLFWRESEREAEREAAGDLLRDLDSDEGAGARVAPFVPPAIVLGLVMVGAAATTLRWPWP